MCEVQQTADSLISLQSTVETRPCNVKWVVYNLPCIAPIDTMGRPTTCCRILRLVQSVYKAFLSYTNQTDHEALRLACFADSVAPLLRDIDSSLTLCPSHNIDERFHAWQLPSLDSVHVVLRLEFLPCTHMSWNAFSNPMAQAYFIMACIPPLFACIENHDVMRICGKIVELFERCRSHELPWVSFAELASAYCSELAHINSTNPYHQDPLNYRVHPWPEEAARIDKLDFDFDKLFPRNVYAVYISRANHRR